MQTCQRFLSAWILSILSLERMSEIKALKTRTDSLESRLNTTVVNLERYVKISDLETQPVIVSLSERVAEINSATIDAATKAGCRGSSKKTSPG